MKLEYFIWPHGINFDIKSTNTEINKLEHLLKCQINIYVNGTNTMITSKKKTETERISIME